MMRKVLMAGTAAMALFGATSAFAAANLLSNGDFENTGFGGTSSYYSIPGDHPIPGDFGWSVPVNNVDIVANGAFGPVLASGEAYNLDLVGYGSTGAIKQTVATTIGQTYRVTLDYSSNNGINNPTADITANSFTVGTLTGSHSWQSFSGLFTAQSTSTDFQISESFGGGNAGVFLDNISLSAVPEPATWAMMLVGFGMVGFAMRKRSNVRTAVSFG